jgi:dTDP-glucose 4,6-dehydratase
LVRAYQRTYGISTTVSNCSNNYGPFHFPEKLIPLMILNLFEGKELPVYGDGLNVRDWLFVDDHAEALWTIVTRGETGQTYNVGGNNEWTNIAIVKKLIELVAASLGKPAVELEKLIRYVKDRPGHDRRYAIDSSKLQNDLGWAPKHDLETGLAETVRWYRENTAWVSGVRSGAYREWIDQNYAVR